MNDSSMLNKVLSNIENELDAQYALTQDTSVSEAANALYHQLYSHAMSLFIAVGFEIVRSPKTNKHSVKLKPSEDTTNLFS